MTLEQFNFWLQGYLEDVKGGLSVKKVETIKAKMKEIQINVSSTGFSSPIFTYPPIDTSKVICNTPLIYNTPTTTTTILAETKPQTAGSIMVGNSTLNN